MTDASKEDLPETNEPKAGDGDGRSSGDHRTLNIGEFHYQRSDADAIAALALADPASARAYIRKEEKADERANTSYRFGLVTTAFLLVAGLVFLAFVLTLDSWLPVVAIALLLGLAVLFRVIMTGEWSDTTWFGQIVHLLARILGSTSNSDEDNTGGQ